MSYRKLRVITTTVLMCVFSLMGLDANALVIYQQAPDTVFPSGFGSFDDTASGLESQWLDNFVLDVDSAIISASWYGYFSSQDASTNEIEGFLIELWSDVGDQPGVPLFSEFILGNAGQMFFSPFPGGTATIFEYTAPLSSPFVAQAGITYWFSVQATLAGDPHWMWLSSAEGDDLHCVDGGGGTPNCAVSLVFPGDQAFSLSAGEPVPEPATIALLALGLAGLGLGRKNGRMGASLSP